VRFRYDVTLPLFALCMFASTASTASKMPHADAIPKTALIRIGAESAAAGHCYLGSGSPLSGFSGGFSGLIVPPDDAYYTLVRRSECTIDGLSGQDPVMLWAGLAGMYFPTQCTISGSMVLVASNGDPICPAPVPSALLCDPVPFTMDPEGLINEPLLFQFAFPPYICFYGDAFIGFIFNASTCPNGEPGNLYLAPCANCVEYNIYSGNPAPGTDLCPLLTGFGLGNPMFFIDVYPPFDPRCVPVATRSPTWGRLKQLYR
jgi:hypothetical protein